MSGIKPINGWGAGKPVHECEGCDADTRGRTLHLVNWDGDWGYVCDACYAQRPPQVIA